MGQCYQSSIDLLRRYVGLVLRSAKMDAYLIALSAFPNAKNFPPLHLSGLNARLEPNLEETFGKGQQVYL